MEWQRLGQILTAKGLVDSGSWRAAVVERDRWGGDLARILIDRRLLTEEVLLRELSQIFKVGVVNLDEYNVPAGVAALLPADLARKHRAIPVRQQSSFLEVAMCDPTDQDAIEELRAHTKMDIRGYLTGPKMLERAFVRYYRRSRRAKAGVDSRVSTGNFLRSDMHDLDALRAQADASDRRAATPPSDPALARMQEMEKRLRGHEERIAMLEALVKRDEDVLRRLFGYLIDKEVATREEIIELLK
jgi:hypothetical protein